MSQAEPPFVITEDWPTPIVRDFGLFLDAVEKPTAFLQKSRQTLDRATLYAVNQEMRTFRGEAHPHMDQTYYPLLNLFQRICMATRLHVMGHERGKVRMIPTRKVAEFRALSPAERYLALLEALWVDCDWEDLFVSRSVADAWSGERLVALLKGMAAGKPVTEHILRHKLRRREWHLPFQSTEVVRLLSFFGFLDYTVAPPRERGYGVKGMFGIDSVTVSPFGKAFLRVLHEERPLTQWNTLHGTEGGPLGFLFDDGLDEEDETAEADESGVGEGEEREPAPFFEAFIPLLAEGSVRGGLSRARPELKDQTCVFRVSLAWGITMTGEAWRTIALSSKHTLDDLHLAIQKAYNFDNDHLYAFYMDRKRHSKHAYNDPRAGDDPPYADEAALGELDLYPRQRFLYLFDFGDGWQFDVELLEVRDTPHKGRPAILAREGKNPEQYPRYDDDDE
jgi:hypothetical protein